MSIRAAWVIARVRVSGDSRMRLVSDEIKILNGMLF